MDGTKSSIDLIWNKIVEWYALLVEMLPNFVLAIVLIVVFYLIARVVRSLARKGFNKMFERESIVNYLSIIVYVSTIVIGLFVALSVMKLDKAVTSLLAGAGIIGLALAFAFQDIAANFMAGIIMAIKAPFQVGDLIETKNIKGRVKRIQLRTTELITLQGQLVVIPNKEVFQNPLYNFSVPAKYRVDLECRVSYGDDLEKVRRVSIDALQSVPHRQEDRDIELFYTKFTGSSINLVTRIWINYHKHTDYLEARSEAMIALKKAYDAADIMIPFPIRTLDFGIRGGETLTDMADGPLNKMNTNQDTDQSNPSG